MRKAGLLVLAWAAVASVAGASTPVQAPGGDVHVDPALGRSLLEGPSVALLTWDERFMTGPEMGAHLREHGLGSVLFNSAPIAVVCASDLGDLGVLAGAPGARGVWSNQPLEVATDKSVPTAFNGPPQDVWQGLGVTGKGVIMAVVDTGLDATHPDLELDRRTMLNMRVLTGHRDTLGPQDSCTPNVTTQTVRDLFRDLSGETLPQIPDTEMTSGHGTHIAGVAAGDGTASGGRYKGVAPEATLIGVAVADTVYAKTTLNDPLSGQYMTAPNTLTAAYGMEYVRDAINYPEIITKVVLAGWTQDELWHINHPLAEMVESLTSAGVTVVFPAGNEGSSVSDCTNVSTCRFNPWAAEDVAIGVGAAAPKTSRTTLADYSSGGDPRTWTFGSGPYVRTLAYQPDLVAPGSGVVSAHRVGLAPHIQHDGSILGAHGETGKARIEQHYVSLTGTSVAAAHVAGAIALMQQAAVELKGCYLTPAQVREALQQTATPMPGYASWQVGAGMLDVTQAVHMARAMPKIPSVDTYQCPPQP